MGGFRPSERPQPPSQHVQIRQAHQHVDLGRVLRQSPVACLGETKLSLDHPKHMLDPRSDRGLLAVAFLLARRQFMSGLALVLYAPTQTQFAAATFVLVTGVAGIGKDDFIFRALLLLEEVVLCVVLGIIL